MPDPVFVRRRSDAASSSRELDRAYPLIVARRGRLARGRRRHRATSTRSAAARWSRASATASDESSHAAAEQARAALLPLQPAVHVPGQEALAEELVGVAPRRPRPRALRHRRRRGERDGAAARPQLPRRARRARAARGSSRRRRPTTARRWPRSALTGRPGLRAPYEPFIAPQPAHPAVELALRPERPGRAGRARPPCSRGRARARRRVLLRADQRRRAARPTRRPTRSGAASTSAAREHGFLICLDEVVTGMGRTGTWFAAEQLPIVPDIITTAKGLGAGYAPGRRGALPPRTSTTAVEQAARAPSSTATPGTARRCPAPSASR